MRVSIITVCYNAGRTLEGTITSVLKQSYDNIEYIIIDGGSSDNSLSIIDKYAEHINRFVSEKDNGIYDAMNKGVRLATGDIIGILNADDEFPHGNVIHNIVQVFKKNPNYQATIGDIVFVNNTGHIKRYYSAKKWDPSKFESGFMPPHPSFYCKRELFEKLGYYRTDFEIAADYELMIRFLKINAIKYFYIPDVIVSMKMGGKSSSGIYSTIKINNEILRACKINGLSTNYFRIYSKYFWKIFEYIKK